MALKTQFGLYNFFQIYEFLKENYNWQGNKWDIVTIYVILIERFMKREDSYEKKALF